MENLDSKIAKLLKKTPQYTRFKRHALSLLFHVTPKKLINLFAIELQRKIHRTKVFGYPYILIIDPGNICNLKCPLCPTGGRAANRDKQFVKFEDFRNIIDRLCTWLLEVTLHNWGEPFLNPDIFRMIRYCADKNIGVNLSTNLNLIDFYAEAVVESGLEYLIVSLDGTTQDIYSKYRVGGDIELVFSNMADMIKKKKALKSKFPFIEWQYIVMKHNCHQIQDARRMAKEIGVDLIRFIPVGLSFDAKDKKELARKWFPYLPSGADYREDTFLQKPIKGGCFYLYRSVTINPVGAVAPCCAVYNEQDDFGNMLEETDFSKIWNNEYYQSARTLFSRKKRSEVETVCNRCSMFYTNP